MTRYAAILALLLAAPALAASPASGPTAVECVDLIEANHYFDENGAHLLDQILFYEWDSRESRYQVRSWRLLKGPGQFPRECPEGYESVWREGAFSRRVVAPKFRETWTQYDPELIERRNLAREDRRELFQRDDPLPPAPEGN